MKIILIHHRSSHHASHSGYGRLKDFLNAKVVYGNFKFPYKLAKAIAAFHSQSLGNYNSGSILKALELYRLLKKNKREKCIVHFLNAERDIRYLGFFKRKFPNAKFVATFHKPPAILKKTITDVSALKKLDGAIAVGTNQVAFLKKWLEMETVVYIPHGVDTHFFVPDASKKKENTLLFVGQHLRDFDTFKKTLPILAAKVKDLRIQVVIHPAYITKIPADDFIEIQTNVNDEDLRHYYQSATILYLPMLDSTACNSILEAMACGLPIITSNVGGNYEYLKNTGNILVSGIEIEKICKETVQLLSNFEAKKRTAHLSREQSLSLDWNMVAEKILIFYKKLANEQIK